MNVLRALESLVQADDARLYELAGNGDSVALDQLLQRYLPQLRGYVRARLGAELRAQESSLDIVQSVCREVLSAREQFDFRGEDRFRGWLFTSALNKIRDRQRRLHSEKRDRAQAFAPETSDGDAFASIAHYLTPSQDAIGRETTLALHDALAALREEHREVISLARIVQLPHRVIAEIMDRSEEATRQLLARAMVQLVRELAIRGIDVTGWNQP
jgi:RNA polymerase sigma factor (sigma-70 family)